MIESLEHQPTNSLSEQIERAKQSALRAEKIARIKSEQDVLTEAFHQGHVTEAEITNALVDLDEESGRIDLDTMSQMEEALRLLKFPEEQIQEIVSHENAHFKKAQDLKIKAHCRIQFVRDPDDTFSIYPTIVIEIPEFYTEKAKKRILAEIAGAPQDPSVHDQRHLNK